jgi:FkbM family methyltransferase
MKTTTKDYSKDLRFKAIRGLNYQLMRHPLNPDIHIKLQHKIAKLLLPRVSGRIVIPTVYGFRLQIDLHPSHTSTMQGSIERNLYFLGAYEAGTLAVIRESLAMRGNSACFVEIGAHNGLMSIFAAHNGASRVFSFEPSPTMFQTLKDNIALSGIKNVVPFCIALGDRKQRVAMKADDQNSGATRITRKGAITNIPMDTLDEVCRKEKVGTIDLILLDVEGYEVQALLGAEKTIATHRPDLIVEYNPREQSQTVLAFLKRHNYLPYILPHTRHIVGKLMPFTKVPETDIMDNLFCFQPERARELGLL